MKINLGPIDWAHESLLKKQKLYHKWHSNKVHHFVHWVVFVSLVLASVLASNVAPHKTKASGTNGPDSAEVQLTGNNAVANSSDAITVKVIPCDINPSTQVNEAFMNVDWALEGTGVSISATNEVGYDAGGAQVQKSCGEAYITWTVTSTVAGVKNLKAHAYGFMGLNYYKDIAITFVNPSSSTPAPSPSSGATKKTTTNPSVAPDQPGAPAIPVLELLTVGNTQLALDKIQGHELKSSDKKAFSGKTIPNGVVHLYFQSDPFEDTATADKDGKWTYDLTRDLGEGEHSLQIAVTDPTTNLTSGKSTPVKFSLIGRAESATNQVAAEMQTTNYLWYLLCGGLFVLGIAGGTESYLYFRKGKGFVLKRILRTKAQI